MMDSHQFRASQMSVGSLSTLLLWRKDGYGIALWDDFAHCATHVIFIDSLALS